MNLKEWAMKRTSLIRIGGLAAMVSSVLYASQTYLLWPLVRTLARLSGTELNPSDFYFIILGFTFLLALGVMAIVALNGQKRGRYGLIATLAALTIAVGVAMVLAGMSSPLYTLSSNLSLLILIVGALVVTLGLVALGIVTITARVLPWWCGAALIASPIFATLLGPLGGLLLVLVGYAIFRAAGHRNQQPSRVR